MHASIPVLVLPFLKTLPLYAPILLFRNEPSSLSIGCFYLSPKLKRMGSLLFASGLSQKVWLCRDRNIKMEADLGKHLHCQEFQSRTCRIPSQSKPRIPTITTTSTIITISITAIITNPKKPTLPDPTSGIAVSTVLPSGHSCTVRLRLWGVGLMPYII